MVFFDKNHKKLLKITKTKESNGVFLTKIQLFSKIYFQKHHYIFNLTNISKNNKKSQKISTFSKSFAIVPLVEFFTKKSPKITKNH